MSLTDLKERARDAKPTALLEISIAEQRELAESNLSHPAAQAYIKSVKAKERDFKRSAEINGTIAKNPAEYFVSVDREDVLAILENKEVIRTRVLVDDGTGDLVPVIQKTLGKTLQ